MMPKDFDVRNERKERKRKEREKGSSRSQKERIRLEKIFRNYRRNMNDAMERQTRCQQMSEQLLSENQSREGN